MWFFGTTAIKIIYYIDLFGNESKAIKINHLHQKMKGNTCQNYQ